MSEPLHLFQGHGIELEYMVVDKATLGVRPIVDQILTHAAGKLTDEVDVGPLCFSNELVSHVVELKTNGPAAELRGLGTVFQSGIDQINKFLATCDARLMPTAMHPFMNPDTDTRLWAHGYNEVYAAYDRIFSCRGHGWSNLQSMHINLPFCGATEFGALHAAIRLVLPILPALAASSPLVEGKVTGTLDTRLVVYRTNQKRVPSLTGRVIPEPVFSPASYQDEILARLYRDITPHDTDDILKHEWLNSRGAIARFERDAIEIRVLDLQEAPVADLALATLIVNTVKALCQQRWVAQAELEMWPVEPLAQLFESAIVDAEATEIRDAHYLAMFGFPGQAATAQDLWHHLRQELCTTVAVPDALSQRALDVILNEGPLARRILKAVGKKPTLTEIRAIYTSLCDCLETGTLFVP